MLKKYINKENVKVLAKEGAKFGVEVISESTKSFINGLFYKIVFVVLLIVIITIGGCVGTDLILDAIKN